MAEIHYFTMQSNIFVAWDTFPLLSTPNRCPCDSYLQANPFVIPSHYIITWPKVITHVLFLVAQFQPLISTNYPCRYKRVRLVIQLCLSRSQKYLAAHLFYHSNFLLNTCKAFKRGKHYRNTCLAKFYS